MLMYVHSYSGRPHLMSAVGDILAYCCTVLLLV